MIENPDIPAARTGEASFPSGDFPEEKASILIVDDREDKRLAISTVVAELGQNVVQAISGRDALRCLLQQDFAVILLDVNMPGMDGFETAFLIRQRKRLENVPIIFVTGISDTENHVSRGYSLGAVDYILTPVVPEVLRAKVSVFVELFKATQQIRRQAEYLRIARDDLEVRVRQRTAELGVANDSLRSEIAERHRAEGEVRKLNGELEDRIRERTAELVAANGELETFTYSIAHDLRAPLRQIHGYAQILEEDCAESLSPEGLHYLHRISQRGRDMGQMVDDLLKLSLISKQEFERKEISLETLLQEARNALQPETEGRRIEWTGTALPPASVGATLMRQVFVNLLSNAIKYSRPRDPARIETGVTRRDGEEVIFIRDNGVGFDMKLADRLFGVFQRLHSSQNFEGTGVGLALVARIIRRHGGRIWAESEIDRGATFYFTLGNEKLPDKQELPKR
ncbi:hypothetical protein SAMN05444156_1712 [Verrucomicrobium sp. GAS474]|uniref:ATP-binding protein n=1 Tax=Verrucomicrobium sp. GAS474 TaxID=1882831 RepID=UPI00087D2BBA|nr:ATP-binding protein [Verrucomicrobium sp. GAS474]SDU05750.1 hypothetical protein SAMN05444156_1712 [Verrucomicrobium sp. GAS474]